MSQSSFDNLITKTPINISIKPQNISDSKYDVRLILLKQYVKLF